MADLFDFIDPTLSARLELNRWIDLGWTPAQVAVMNDLDPRQLADLHADRLEAGRTDLDELTSSLAAAGVDLARLDPRELVPARATIRRLQALHVMAWGPVQIAEDLHLPVPAVLALPRAQAVPAALALAVAALVARRGLRMGTDLALRGRARGLGWAGPLDWDERSIESLPARASATPEQVDDVEQPRTDEVDEVVVARLVEGTFDGVATRAEQDAAIARLAAAGRSDAEIAALIGVVKCTVQRRRSKHAIPAGIPQIAGRARAVTAPTPAEPATVEPATSQGAPDAEQSADRIGAPLPALRAGAGAGRRDHGPRMGMPHLRASRDRDDHAGPDLTAVLTALAGEGAYALDRAGRLTPVTSLASPRSAELSWAQRERWLGAATMVVTDASLAGLRFFFTPDLVEAFCRNGATVAVPGRLLVHDLDEERTDVEAWLAQLGLRRDLLPGWRWGPQAVAA